MSLPNLGNPEGLRAILEKTVKDPCLVNDGANDVKGLNSFRLHLFQLVIAAATEHGDRYQRRGARFPAALMRSTSFSTFQPSTRAW